MFEKLPMWGCPKIDKISPFAPEVRRNFNYYCYKRVRNPSSIRCFSILLCYLNWSIDDYLIQTNSKYYTFFGTQKILSGNGGLSLPIELGDFNFEWTSWWSMSFCPFDASFIWISELHQDLCRKKARGPQISLGTAHSPLVVERAGRLRI